MSKKIPSGRSFCLLQMLYKQGYIRIGNDFIDVTEKGWNVLGVSHNPVFPSIRVSFKREKVYQRIIDFPVQRVLRMVGDMERERLDNALKNELQLKGIQDTKSNIIFQSLKESVEDFH